VLDQDDRAKRCDLLLALGEALVSAGETTRARESVATDALAAAQAIGDRLLASRTCQLVWRTYSRVTGSFGGEFERWAELADRYADDGTVQRVHADVWLAMVSAARGRGAEARGLEQRALQLALRLDDPAGIVMTSLQFLFAPGLTPEENGERLAVAEALSMHSLVTVAAKDLALLLMYLGYVSLTWGRREEAEQHWQRAREAVSRSRDAEAAFIPFQIDGMLGTLDGELERVLQIEAQMRAAGIGVDREQAGRQFGARVVRPALFYLGRAAEALPSIRPGQDLFFNRGINAAQRAACLAHMGQAAESEEILSGMLSARDMSQPDDSTPTNALRYLLEAAVLLGEINAARVLSERLSSMAGLLHTSAEQTHCIGRFCGAAAVLYGDHNKARGYYEQAIELCENVRFRPELALTRLGLAELLLDHYPDERAAAIEHLDFAIGELRGMKMQPALERALRHKEVLKA